MDWLEEMLGMELSTGAQLTLLVLGLAVALALLFWIFRMIFGYGGTRLAKNRQPRLSVTDAAMVDDKRRLVLVRRDNIEHLIMIGGPTDIVIEQAIGRSHAAPPSREPVPSQEPGPDLQTRAENTARSHERRLEEPAPVAKSTAAATGAAAATAANTVEPPAEARFSHIQSKETAESFRSEAAARLNDGGVTQKRSETVETQGAPSDGGTLDDVKPDRGEVETPEPAPRTGAGTTPESPASPKSESMEKQSTEPKQGSSRTEDEMQRLLDELTNEKN